MLRVFFKGCPCVVFHAALGCHKASRITFAAWGKEISSHWKDLDEKMARAEVYFQILGAVIGVYMRT